MLDVSCGWEIIWKMLYIWLSAPPHFDHKTTRCNHAVAPLRSSFLMAFFLTGAKHKPAVQVKKTKQTKTNTIFNSIGMEGRVFFLSILNRMHVVWKCHRCVDSRLAACSTISHESQKQMFLGLRVIVCCGRATGCLCKDGWHIFGAIG